MDTEAKLRPVRLFTKKSIAERMELRQVDVVFDSQEADDDDGECGE